MSLKRLALGMFMLLLAAEPVLDAAPDTRNSLTWNQTANRVSAEILSWDITELLQHVAQATSWQIYLEPQTQYRVSTKFRDRPPGDALKLLLGNLSFALLPQTNGPAKLYVFRTSLQEATQLIKPVTRKIDPTAKPIPNELVVSLRAGARIDEIARKLGAKVVGRIDGANAYRLSFESAEAAEAARESLKNNPDVTAIDNNYFMRNPDNPEGLAFSSGFPFELKPRNSSDCMNPVIVLIDTAVQPTGTPMDSFLLPGVNVTGTEPKLSGDRPTHGDTMYGMALRGLALKGNETSVKILPIDVYGNNPTTTTFDVTHGIVEGVNRGANVVNLSLGSAGDSELLRNMIKKSSEQGVLFLAAAGNEPSTAPTYPAAYPEVVAVTAGTRDGSIAPYANRGDFVDIAAPGSAIIPFNGTSWLVTGTSASTAYASGLAASFIDCTKVSNAQVISSLQGLLPVKR